MPEPLGDTLLAEIEAAATEMARAAGSILRKHFGGSLDVEYKDKNERDPVTNADKRSQELLKQSIADRFPEHGILAEEDEEQDTSAPDFVWVLDPLDGTKNFIGGLPVYACSVGVLHRGVPVAGAVYLPWPCEAAGVVLHARRGGGAFVDQEPISVFQSEEPKGNALVTLPGGFGAVYRMQKPMRGKVGEVRVTGSIAYELAMTATGVLQYSVTTGPRLWDVAGGVVLVMEAGGLVMRGTRATGLKSFLGGTLWEPVETLVPSWQSGHTTMKELRRWSAPLVLGPPGVVHYVTANLGTRPLLGRRLARITRRLRRRAK